MDPNANLEEQRQIVATLLAGPCGDADNLGMRLAELAQALDEWITKGGFLPADWQKGRAP